MRTLKLLAVMLVLSVTGAVYAAGAVQNTAQPQETKTRAASCCAGHKAEGQKTAEHSCCAGHKDGEAASCCKAGASCCKDGAECCKTSAKAASHGASCCGGGSCARAETKAGGR